MNNKKIALFIDAENIPHKFIDKIINDLKDLGEIVISKVYADWSNDAVKGWNDKITKYALEPIYPKAYTKGKNSSDIKLTHDVTAEYLQNDNIDIIAIATSDSDFTSLIIDVKKKLDVILFSESKANNYFKNIATFIELSDKKISNNTKKSYLDIIKEAIFNISKNKKSISVAEIGQYIKKQYQKKANDFGDFDTWGKLLKFHKEVFKITYVGINNRTMLVSLK